MKTIKLLALSIILISFYNCEDDGPRFTGYPKCYS